MLDFLRKTAVGVDISSDTIEVAELMQNGDLITAVSLGKGEIPPGILDKGRIVDRAKLEKIVRETLHGAEPHPITPRRVVFGLPDSIAFIHTFDVESTDAKNLPRLIEKEIKENIPCDPHDLVFDYRIIYEDAEGRDVLLVAAPRSVLDEWQSFFETLSLDVVFDMEALALFRGLFGKPPPDPVCIVDIGTSVTTIALFDRGGLWQTHSVPSGGRALSESVARSLDVSHEKTESLFRTEGLSDIRSPLSLVLVKGMQAIVKELVAAIAYFADRTGAPIKKVVVTGGVSAMPGIAAYLSKELSIPASVGSSLISSVTIPGIFIESAGLALRGLDHGWASRDPLLSLPRRGSSATLLSTQKSVHPPPSSKTQKTQKKERIILSPPVLSSVPNRDREYPLTQELRDVRRHIRFFTHRMWRIAVGYPFADRIRDMSARLIVRQRFASLVFVGIISCAGVVSLIFFSPFSSNKPSELMGDGGNVDTVRHDDDVTVSESAPLHIIPSDSPRNRVRITETPTGWLNVRRGPGTSFERVTRINPGESYEILTEKNGWYEIKLEKETGWIIGEYTRRIEP